MKRTTYTLAALLAVMCIGVMPALAANYTSAPQFGAFIMEGWLLINATTNLPVNDLVHVTIEPEGKNGDDHLPEVMASGDIAISPGSHGMDCTTFAIHTSGLHPGHYCVTITSSGNHEVVDRALFSLV